MLLMQRARLWSWLRPSFRFSTERSSDGQDPPKKQRRQASEEPRVEEYVFLPVHGPIFPSMALITRINPHLERYLAATKAKNIVAVPVKDPGQIVEFEPASYSQFIQKYGLKDDDSSKERSDLVELKGEIEDLVSGYFTFDKSYYQPKTLIPTTSSDNLQSIGTLCKFFLHHEDQKLSPVLNLRGELRVHLQPSSFGPFTLLAKFRIPQTQISMTESISYSKFKQLIAVYERIRKISPINFTEIQPFVSSKNLELLCGFICATKSVGLDEAYRLFAEPQIKQKFETCHALYQKYEKELGDDWQKFEKEYEGLKDPSLEKDKLKHIYEYLKIMFTSGNSVQFVERTKKELATLKLPLEVLNLIESQLRELSEMPESSPDAVRKKHFIQTILSYPFGKMTTDTFELDKAAKILDEDHYGMKDLKQRILEFIAVAQRKGTLRQKVILLNGPPGVGKTSVAKSIARCLGRNFARISLGGEYDVSIMKGHRKTYVGAYPGKVYQSIKNCKSENPVILLDEIDKVEVSHRGNLMEVIMEVLDPAQNSRFKDEFVDIAIDLSNVLFVCTSNDMANIIQPLRDRMEIMQVSGYTTAEKVHIFHRFIAKKAALETGLPFDFEFSDRAVLFLIDGFCREAGVRSLQQTTSAIFNKLALKYLEGTKSIFSAPRNSENAPFRIEDKDVEQLLGQPKHTSDRLFPGTPPPGVMIGLAYNDYGGCILFIESLKTNHKPCEKGKGSLTVTGRVAEVMKESCSIAYSYARQLMSLSGNPFFQENDVHINFPDIQIGKDGPSAGITITSTLLSLATGKPACAPLAMTGEINLSGEVCAIGGVKEKLLAAKRQHISRVVFPKQNERDVKLLDAEFVAGMEINFAQRYEQVYELVFGEPLKV